MQKRPLVQDQTEFEKSLDRLESRIEWIPAGWQQLYIELRRRLIGVKSTVRQNTHLDVPWPDMELLYIESKNADPIVEGILRKVARSSRYICCECGRMGKPRLIEDREVVLCSGCAGLRLLELDLSRFNAWIAQREMESATVLVPSEALTPRLAELMKVTGPQGSHSHNGTAWLLDLQATKAWINQSLNLLREQIGSQG